MLLQLLVCMPVVVPGALIMVTVIVLGALVAVPVLVLSGGVPLAMPVAPAGKYASHAADEPETDSNAVFGGLLQGHDLGTA